MKYLIPLLFLSLASCKKDEKTEFADSYSGYVLAAYVPPTTYDTIENVTVTINVTGDSIFFTQSSDNAVLNFTGGLNGGDINVPSQAASVYGLNGTLSGQGNIDANNLNYTLTADLVAPDVTYTFAGTAQ